MEPNVKATEPIHVLLVEDEILVNEWVTQSLSEQGFAVQTAATSLLAQRATVARYRVRILQAEAMGEFALSEVLRGIIVQEQEHEIDLSAALGINVPPPEKLLEKRTAGAR